MQKSKKTTKSFLVKLSGIEKVSQDLLESVSIPTKRFF